MLLREKKPSHGEEGPGCGSLGCSAVLRPLFVTHQKRIVTRARRDGHCRGACLEAAGGMCMSEPQTETATSSGEGYRLVAADACRTGEETYCLVPGRSVHLGGEILGRFLCCGRAVVGLVV